MEGSYEETLLKRHRVCFAILGIYFWGMLTRQGMSSGRDRLGKGGEFRDRGVRTTPEDVQPEDENQGGKATLVSSRTLRGGFKLVCQGY